MVIATLSWATFYEHIFKLHHALGDGRPAGMVMATLSWATFYEHIFKLHYALGDGNSLVGTFFSCLQRAINPFLSLTFPSRLMAEPEVDNV
ncbi:unnamed protein product [Malus baccata var. baccata]